MLQSRLRYLVGVGTLLSVAFVNPLRPFRGVADPRRYRPCGLLKPCIAMTGASTDDCSTIPSSLSHQRIA